MRLFYYQDPSHGWVAVKRKVIQSLGVESSISGYSYQRGKTVYLEEDCDAPLVLRAMKLRNMEYELFSKHTNKVHPIRSYESFSVS